MLSPKPDWSFPAPMGRTTNPQRGKCRHRLRKTAPCRHLRKNGTCKAKLWCLFLSLDAPAVDLGWLRSTP